MATKKPASKKAPAKKPVAKPAPKKAAPAKKVVPAKKAAKPVAKPAPKKAAPAKKVVPAKKAAKPVAKPAPKKAAPAKKIAKPIAHHPNHPKVETKKISTPVAHKPTKKVEPPKEVKVPKTSVKTSVPYSPGYTPLEKRIESTKSTEPMVRYNDSELNEFRELIAKKLEAAKKELAYLQGLITRKDEMGGDESESRYVTMEDGGMSMEREQLSQMASRQITYIDHLEKAIMRIENKTYGICRVTGRLIDKARLRAVPHATLSLEAKLGLVKPTSEQ